MTENIFMKMEDKIFIDTNVLIYTNNPDEEPLGKAAFTKLTELVNSNAKLYISSQILKEYANAVIREAIKQNIEIKQIINDVLENIKYFEEQFIVLFESKEIIKNWKELLNKLRSNKQVFDYSIIATMKANNIKNILTHNISDFKNFDEITVIPLLNEFNDNNKNDEIK